MHSSPEKQACLRSEDPDSRIFEVETVDGCLVRVAAPN